MQRGRRLLPKTSGSLLAVKPSLHTIYTPFHWIRAREDSAGKGSYARKLFHIRGILRNPRVMQRRRMKSPEHTGQQMLQSSETEEEK